MDKRTQMLFEQACAFRLIEANQFIGTEYRVTQQENEDEVVGHVWWLNRALHRIEAEYENVRATVMTDAIKAELDYCVKQYPDETAADHLDEILRNIKRELLSKYA